MEKTLKNMYIACTQYDFQPQIFSLLLSFIDRKFKIVDPNSKINYPIYIPPNILTYKFALPTEPNINSSQSHSSGASSSKRSSKVNIILLGESSVGKTATLYRFIRNEFRGEWDPTTEDIFEKTMKIDDNVVVFQIGMRL